MPFYEAFAGWINWHVMDAGVTFTAVPLIPALHFLIEMYSNFKEVAITDGMRKGSQMQKYYPAQRLLAIFIFRLPVG